MHDDKTDQNHLGAGGRGVLLGILQGGVLAGSPNPDQKQTKNQKLAFSTPIFRPDILSPYPFSVLAFRQKLCHNLLSHNYIRVQTKNLELQMHFEFTYFYFFLIHLELK